jgi:hypothetical protein
MRLLGRETSEAVFSGTALQVVLADEEGLVLDAMGAEFQPDALVAAFLGSGSAIDRVRRLLHVGVVSEITMRLQEENVTLAARFFHHEDCKYTLIIVVPPASSPKILATRIIRSFVETLQQRRKER